MLYFRKNIGKYMLKNINELIELIKNNDGYTPLHISSQEGHLNIVKYLIEECKCDPNIKDKYGKTPLDVTNKSEIIKYFSKMGYIANNIIIDIFVEHHL